MYLARPLAAVAALVLSALVPLCDASAQQIYKIVGPDGRVTFSDKPPLDAKSQPAKVVSLTAEGGTPTASLPFELRQVVARYPVTFYTAPGCQTCAMGRQLLVARGVPFGERTIASQDDIEALKRLTGATNVPVLSIGSQLLKGYSDSEWTQFLDAAGYPKTSLLPASYVPAPALPLVAQGQKAGGDAAPATAAAPASPAAPGPASPAPENPAGITF